MTRGELGVRRMQVECWYGGKRMHEVFWEHEVYATGERRGEQIAEEG